MSERTKPAIGQLKGEYTTWVSMPAQSHSKTNSERAATAREWNRPEYLNEFIGRTSISQIPIGDTRIHLTISDTPYSDNHCMIVVENDEGVSRPDWRIAEIIHNQNDEVRHAYWLSTLTLIDHFTKASEDGDFVVFSENTCCQVTNEDVRLPRTIGLVHGHIVNFSQANINNLPYHPGHEVPRFNEEIDNWEKHGDDFIQALNVSPLLPNRAIFAKRQRSLPPGYETTIQKRNTIYETAKVVAEVTKGHHEAFINEVPILLRDPHSPNPQPSYYTYLYPSGDDIILGYSPAIVSHNGSISASGIKLVRSVNPDFAQKNRTNNYTTIANIGKKIESQLKL